jgi:hypothetical protein
VSGGERSGSGRAPASGFPEPPGEDPGDRSRDPEAHAALSNRTTEPDATEWPDPYEEREDPREGGHPPTGSTSTIEPHPTEDPEAAPAEPPERDRLDN